MRYEVRPVSLVASPSPPTLAVGKEAIKLAVPQMEYRDGVAEFSFDARVMLPDRDFLRYHDPSTALVVVVSDVDQRGGFAVRTIEDFIRWAPGAGPPESNLKELPLLPLRSRGDPSGASSYGGFTVSWSIRLESPHPTHRPSVFIYAILENYVSNTVGLDLIGGSIVNY